MNMRKVTQDFRFEEWKRQVEECQSSGKSVSAWCEENGLKPKTYYYRLNKVRDRVCRELSEVKSQEIKTSSNPSFAEVSIKRTVSRNGPAITLRLGSAEVDIHNGAEAAVIENTLQILRELC
jgi:transposase-like protein